MREIKKLDGKEIVKSRLEQFYFDSVVNEFFDGSSSYIIKDYQLRELHKSGRLNNLQGLTKDK